MFWSVFVLVHISWISCDEGFLWTNWNSWSDVCERKCSEPYGARYRTRLCLYCKNTTCSEDEAVPSRCSSNANRAAETKLCYVAEHCSGTGVFTGVYDNDWRPVGKCRRERSCLEPGDQLYVRDCKASSKTLSFESRHIDFKCSFLNEAEKKEPCIVQNCLDKNPIEVTARSVYWSTWKCDDKCNSDNKSATRHVKASEKLK
jgi:hypothetical protein